MAHNTLIGGTGYEISGGRTLIGGTGYDIGSGRTLKGGTGYDITFGTPASDLAVGSSVWMNVDGVATEWLTVNQGIPSDSSLYDSSCNGTWLLMKDLYETRVWDSTSNDYANSDIHAYLNGTFLGMFDSDIQSAIKQVKLPYRNGTGIDGSDSSGANGLSTKIFLLSGYEVGWTTSTNSNFPVDGACLSYFSGTSATDSKRIGYYNGIATRWWLRSPSTVSTILVRNVKTDGYYVNNKNTESHGVRPALVLPSNIKIDNSGFIIA